MDAADVSAIKAAVDLYQTQYAATDRLWAYFSTVTVAVLGFSIGSDKVTRSFAEASVVAAGYVAFCVGNHAALALSHAQLIQFADLARDVAGRRGVALSALNPFAGAAVSGFYWTVVAAVCGGILLITHLRRRRAA